MEGQGEVGGTRGCEDKGSGRTRGSRRDYGVRGQGEWEDKEK